MANSLKCNLCSKPATVHFTQIYNNKVHKVDLCEACANAKGVTDPGSFSLSDLLAKGGAGLTEEINKEIAAITGSDAAVGIPLIADSAPSGLSCPRCGFTQAEFKKQGRFGCPHCYETFKEVLSPLLADMHKGTTHIGKVPRHAVARKTYHDRITKLETTLADAIKAERYEDAARYRDEISQVKQAYGKPDSAS